MSEYKCGDCFYADLCEKSGILLGFSRDNPAYCSVFLNSAYVATVQENFRRRGNRRGANC